MADQDPALTPPPEPARLACALCGGQALVHWQRRLTDDEFAAHLAQEQERRDARALLADPQLPQPDPAPLPTAADCTRPVYACGQHAIGIEAAALVHAKTCTAPDARTLPACDCTPKPTPAPAPESETVRLPDSWIRA